MSFPLTEELTRQTIETITEVRRDPGDRDNAAAIIDLVLRLTDVGLHEYFVRPLEQAKAGMMALGTAKIGITTAKRGISVIVSKVIRGMSADQLRSIVDSMEQMLIRP
ncbi:MAG: hypothetical protein GY722_23085 [bacterium]|nr:hypothetical protein [bacterium]